MRLWSRGVSEELPPRCALYPLISHCQWDWIMLSVPLLHTKFNKTCSVGKANRGSWVQIPPRRALIFFLWKKTFPMCNWLVCLSFALLPRCCKMHILSFELGVFGGLNSPAYICESIQCHSTGVWGLPCVVLSCLVAQLVESSPRKQECRGFDPAWGSSSFYLETKSCPGSSWLFCLATSLLSHAGWRSYCATDWRNVDGGSNWRITAEVWIAVLVPQLYQWRTSFWGTLNIPQRQTFSFVINVSTNRALPTYTWKLYVYSMCQLQGI